MYKEEIYAELNKLKTKDLIKSEIYNSLSMEQRFKYMLECRKSLIFGAAFVILIFIYTLIPSSENELEAALILGKSTRQDFQRFKENGGLDAHKDKTWKGYGVQSVSLQYDSKGKLSNYQIILDKVGYKHTLGTNSATVASVKSALSGICPNDWDVGLEDTYWAKRKGKTICSIDASGSTIGIDVNSE